MSDITQTVPVTPPAKPEPSSARLMLTLGVAGLISGAVLVGSYIYSLPLIEAAKAEALKEAIYQLLPGCSRYETLVLSSGKLVPEAEAPATEGAAPPKIYHGFNKAGEPVGYAIQAQEIGFSDAIVGLIGYLPDKKLIIGLKILESKETPGLGDKIFKDEAFQKNFKSLQVEPDIKLVKHGEKKNPNEVDAITGATISSRAVVGLLNIGMNTWKSAIDAYESENKQSN